MLNLDQVLQLIEPTQTPITIDGKVYTLKPIRIVDLKRLAELEDHTDADNVGWLHSLFDGPAPGFLEDMVSEDEQAKQAASIKLMVLVMAITEAGNIQKKLPLAREAIASALAAMRAPTKLATSGASLSASSS